MNKEVFAIFLFLISGGFFCKGEIESSSDSSEMDDSTELDVSDYDTESKLQPSDKKEAKSEKKVKEYKESDLRMDVSTTDSQAQISDNYIRFVVIGDVHINKQGHSSSHFRSFIAEIPSLKPHFVLLAGDLTSGNCNDGCGLWCNTVMHCALKRILQPLREAGIPVFPVAGNHDFHSKWQRKAYYDSYSDLKENVSAKYKVTGEPPFYYSFDAGHVHVSALHLVSRSYPEEVDTWLDQDLSETDKSVKLAFGHIPLETIFNLGKTSTRYKRRLGGILAKNHVKAFFSGHEHLFWDTELDFDGYPLRQIICGAPSYTFAIQKSHHYKNCKGRKCRMPGSGLFFKIQSDFRENPSRVFTLVDVKGTNMDVRPLSVNIKGEIVDFYIDYQEKGLPLYGQNQGRPVHVAAKL